MYNWPRAIVSLFLIPRFRRSSASFRNVNNFFIFLTFLDDTVDRRKLGIRNTVTQGFNLIVHMPGFLGL